MEMQKQQGVISRQPQQLKAESNLSCYLQEMGGYRHNSAPDAQQAMMRMNSLPDKVVGGLRKSSLPEAGPLRHSSMYTFGGPGYNSMQYSGSGSTNSDLSATDRTALTDRYFWAHQMVDIQVWYLPSGNKALHMAVCTALQHSTSLAHNGSHLIFGCITYIFEAQAISCRVRVRFWSSCWPGQCLQGYSGHW